MLSMYRIFIIMFVFVLALLVGSEQLRIHCMYDALLLYQRYTHTKVYEVSTVVYYCYNMSVLRVSA